MAQRAVLARRGLHLLYFAWYHWAESQFVTGLEYDPDANELWLEIFDSFDGEHRCYGANTPSRLSTPCALEIFL